MTRPDDNLHDRLRRALPAAIKARDRPAVSALRSALAAIDNAGAIDPTQAVPVNSETGPAASGPGPDPDPPLPPGPGTDPVATKPLGTHDTGIPPPASTSTGPGRPASPGTGTRSPASAGAGAGPPASSGGGAEHSDDAAIGAGHPELAGTVAGVGAAEVERRGLSQAQMEAIVRAEITERETAATGYEQAGQLEQAERLRAEAKVLLSHLNTT
jgi:uncharacterized protein